MKGYVQNEAGLLVPEQKILGIGRYDATLIRDGKVIDEWFQENLVVNSGLNDLLNVYFNSGTQRSVWYIGMFEGNYTPVAADTGATIAGNATESTAYTSATRPQWQPASPSGQSITNSANRAAFTFNATKTIYGAFLISTATKSDTVGQLFSASQFATPRAVVNLDELLLTYSFTASSV